MFTGGLSRPPFPEVSGRGRERSGAGYG